METFLDDEELAYPTGSLRQSMRRFAAICPDGIVRRGVCGIPDTFFSIPARVKAYGKTVAGYVTGGEDGYLFIPYTYRKNHTVFTR